MISFFGLGLAWQSVTKIAPRNGNYLTISVGMSIYLLLGGFLSYFRIANTAVILFILSFGLIFSISRVIEAPPKLNFSIFKRNSKHTFAFLLCGCLVVYLYALGVLNQYYNGSDDFEGYFTFAAKFRQISTLGTDSYSERRIVSSLGGQSFLDGTILHVLPINYLHIIDHGVGFVTLVITAFWYLHSRTKSTNLSLMAVVVICISSLMHANITATYTLALLTFALISLVLDQPIKTLSTHTVTIALVGMACLTLKNSAIPMVVGLLGAHILKVLLHSRSIKGTLNQFFILIITSSFLIFPWCYQLFKCCGTFLYPILGKGFHGSRYGDFNFNVDVISWKFIKSLLGTVYFAPSYSVLMVIFLVVFVSIYLARRKTSPQLRETFLLISILIIQYISISVGTAGYSTYRYAGPFILAALIYLLQYLKLSIFSGFSLLVVFPVMISLTQVTQLGWGYTSLLSKFNPNQMFSTNVVNFHDSATRIQATIPVNKKVLLRTAYNYAFNFKRNEIQIADFPGAASPPPGVPLFGSGKEFKDYLLSQNIKYVIFQYSGLFDKESNSGRLDADFNSWLKVEAENAFAFHDRMLEIVPTSQVLFDNGTIVAIQVNKDES